MKLSRAEALPNFNILNAMARLLCLKNSLLLFLVCCFGNLQAQNTSPDIASLVNVFLGTSGDHGQLSPAASYPFSMLSIGPQTYPKLHAGYEYEAKRFLGFTHNRFEGVGCQGSGGNILIKPFIGTSSQPDLVKLDQSASPGYYQVSFTNKIKAEMSVYGKSGMHRYQFPEGQETNGFFIDLSHSLANKFVAEQHQVKGNSISGWVQARTTCNAGTYKIYYYLEFPRNVLFKEQNAHQLIAEFPSKLRNAEIRVALSSVSEAYARASLYTGSFDEMKAMSRKAWNQELSKIRVDGDISRKKLFYSLLYRTLQSPYNLSEEDGTFRATDGSIQKSRETMYNGWAIWDNYRTQLPLLSVGWPEKYQGMVSSLARLYESGKKDFATNTEPSNTVRTEHAIVVLLDSYRKGYKIDFEKIADSLIKDADRLDFSKPDKALESSYDNWALSEILAIIKRPELSSIYKAKALQYKDYWNKDFKDITKKDVDKVQARGLYQGTIWQYRWFVPFDMKGLIELSGGMNNYTKQLDYFFENDLYNHANEPDLQAPLMYNVTTTPAKSQELMHRFAVDTVIQYYFNENSRGIDPFVDVVYKNQPKAYIRTMDDDGGAMSAWYVLTACGFMPACPGWPVYYLNVPLFKTASFTLPGNKSFEVSVENYAADSKYIKKVILNGKVLDRNYITHEEIRNGGTLKIVASTRLEDTMIISKPWISKVE
ncbi:GH92 family glycosyl hydrolase [Desertivirga xinjiangensis]|uniref:GH92 family glycosyl hydrolase n=1 Tax=Desertivirga xinjiangensis TaxID=539206 RepID=UPI00210BDC37|nr:GH92 family glycosyl hydrolase [Pedobacter xinjiangensis]